MAPWRGKINRPLRQVLAAGQGRGDGSRASC